MTFRACRTDEKCLVDEHGRVIAKAFYTFVGDDKKALGNMNAYFPIKFNAIEKSKYSEFAWHEKKAVAYYAGEVNGNSVCEITVSIEDPKCNGCLNKFYRVRLSDSETNKKDGSNSCEYVRENGLIASEKANMIQSVIYRSEKSNKSDIAKIGFTSANLESKQLPGDIVSFVKTGNTCVAYYTTEAGYYSNEKNTRIFSTELTNDETGECAADSYKKITNSKWQEMKSYAKSLDNSSTQLQNAVPVSGVRLPGSIDESYGCREESSGTMFVFEDKSFNDGRAPTDEMCRNFRRSSEESSKGSFYKLTDLPTEIDNLTFSFPVDKELGTWDAFVKSVGWIIVPTNTIFFAFTFVMMIPALQASMVQPSGMPKAITAACWTTFVM